MKEGCFFWLLILEVLVGQLHWFSYVVTLQDDNGLVCGEEG